MIRKLMAAPSVGKNKKCFGLPFMKRETGSEREKTSIEISREISCAHLATKSWALLWTGQFSVLVLFQGGLALRHQSPGS